ncbi:hypothetical protein [Roseicyclus sp.]|uniref:hypothetical protein n=1 Tax=Roseicyclus sp. TaxID=1914329 RepID=UPI003F9ECD73
MTETPPTIRMAVRGGAVPPAPRRQDGGTVVAALPVAAGTIAVSWTGCSIRRSHEPAGRARRATAPCPRTETRIAQLRGGQDEKDDQA